MRVDVHGAGVLGAGDRQGEVSLVGIADVGLVVRAVSCVGFARVLVRRASSAAWRDSVEVAIQ